MHYQQTGKAAILLVLYSVISLSHGGTIKAPPSSIFSALAGGWSPTFSSSAGISGLGAVQEGNAGQTISLTASGSGMVIGLQSDVLSDGYTSLSQSGGTSADSAAEVSNSTGITEILPESTITLSLANADNISLELDSHAVGFEVVDSALEQQAQISNGPQSGGWVPSPPVSSGGWSTSPPAISGGWEASTPGGSAGGWGATLQGGKK